MAEIQEEQLVFPAVCNTLSVIASKWHSSKICRKICNSYLWRRTFQGMRGNDLLECQAVSIPLGLLGISMAFNAMRDVGLPYLCHNQMASYFEPLCVIIDGPALGFLHTRTNLSPFTKYFREEGQLDEYIGYFTQVLLKRD